MPAPTPLAAVRLAVAGLAVVLLTLGCGPAPLPPIPSTPQTTVSTDVEGLLRAVILPRRPAQSWWLQRRLGSTTGAPGPTDVRTAAVIVLRGEATRLSGLGPLTPCHTDEAVDEALMPQLQELLGSIPPSCLQRALGVAQGYSEGTTVVLFDGVVDVLVLRHVTT